MGVLDNLKERLGFGEGWEDEYLHEMVGAVGADNAPAEGADAKAGAAATAGTVPAGSAASVAAGEKHGDDRYYAYESPYASGAAPRAVTKHIRRPDLERASAVSGTSLREVPEQTTQLQAQSEDGSYRIRPKAFSDTEARAMAERFRSGTVVSLDLTLAASADRQRFIDFSAGLVFALDGTLSRSAHYVYVLTPRTIDVLRRN